MLDLRVDFENNLLNTDTSSSSSRLLALSDYTESGRTLLSRLISQERERTVSFALDRLETCARIVERCDSTAALMKESCEEVESGSEKNSLKISAVQAAEALFRESSWVVPCTWVVDVVEN